MKRTGGMLVLAVLAGSGVAVAGCEASNSTSQASSADVVDVSSGSTISLALRGGIGPIISGQTLMKATVMMTDLELVDGSGSPVALSGNGYRVDLLRLQNGLGQLFSKQAVKAGHYAAMRFRLESAWLQAQDVNGAIAVYASPDADKSQFPKGAKVRTLDLGGLDSGGFAKCAPAPGGIVVNGASSLALQFALAQSLTVSSSSDWALTPACALVDQSTYSSLDVDFEPASDGSSDQELANGFQEMLLDSNMSPISEVPIAATQSGTYGVHFADLAAFQGPFVAALIPPVDYTLQSGVAFSVDVKPSASASASITGTSLQVVSGRLLDVATDDHCTVVQSDPHGHILAQKSLPVAAVEVVAPKTHASIPALPGNPAPGHDDP